MFPAYTGSCFGFVPSVASTKQLIDFTGLNFNEVLNKQQILKKTKHYNGSILQILDTDKDNGSGRQIISTHTRSFDYPAFANIFLSHLKVNFQTALTALCSHS